MKDIVIIGAGGFGREVAWLIEDINKANKSWNIIGFVDDDKSIIGTIIDGYNVVGDVNWLVRQELYVVNAIGNSKVKKNIMNKLKDSNNKYPILIHPNVIKADSSKIGEGTIICANNIVSINADVGRHVSVNFNCTVGHDIKIGDYSVISPGVNISGFVNAEECVEMGTGSAIIQGVSVGKNTVIGAGSVVVKDLPGNCTAVGTPAKPIKFHE